MVNRIFTDDSGLNLFASVTITLAGRPMDALEWWTFDDGRVHTIRAFYWDTAAMSQR
ncbi:hypothetical protein [Nocardia sp. NPDC059236]|uniref:hypothetical protein n=1 Tax=Nocardia sp. NPDC059236 TaxID=3346783 RepID=UPI00368A520F